MEINPDEIWLNLYRGYEDVKIHYITFLQIYIINFKRLYPTFRLEET